MNSKYFKKDDIDMIIIMWSVMTDMTLTFTMSFGVKFSGNGEMQCNALML